jgi:hypothetical protein
MTGLTEFIDVTSSVIILTLKNGLALGILIFTSAKRTEILNNINYFFIDKPPSATTVN